MRSALGVCMDTAHTTIITPGGRFTFRLTRILLPIVARNMESGHVDSAWNMPVRAGAAAIRRIAYILQEAILQEPVH